MLWVTFLILANVCRQLCNGWKVLETQLEALMIFHIINHGRLSKRHKNWTALIGRSSPDFTRLVMFPQQHNLIIFQASYQKVFKINILT